MDGSVSQLADDLAAGAPMGSRERLVAATQLNSKAFDPTFVDAPFYIDVGRISGLSGLVEWIG